MSEQADRRAAERFPVNGDSSCSFAGQVAEGFGVARIQNVSMDGIGLLLARALEPGALLAVVLTNPSRGFSKTVLVRVVHVTAQPAGYLVGGTFSAPLTYQELSALVL
jgi:hypothetical protein